MYMFQLIIVYSGQKFVRWVLFLLWFMNYKKSHTFYKLRHLYEFKKVFAPLYDQRGQLNAPCCTQQQMGLKATTKCCLPLDLSMLHSVRNKHKCVHTIIHLFAVKKLMELFILYSEEISILQFSCNINK